MTSVGKKQPSESARGAIVQMRTRTQHIADPGGGKSEWMPLRTQTDGPPGLTDGRITPERSASGPTRPKRRRPHP
ncbi:unnamed protein product [Toxocara canis]|uniref:Uncharacterized protein n=1 Tax=Toxocara canis TaxID=6265 RepID=A0A183U5L5_TOXCA|nr:unnamed protein product [Toxocara canis]